MRHRCARGSGRGVHARTPLLGLPRLSPRRPYSKALSGFPGVPAEKPGGPLPDPEATRDGARLSQMSSPRDAAGRRVKPTALRHGESTSAAYLVHLTSRVPGAHCSVPVGVPRARPWLRRCAPAPRLLDPRRWCAPRTAAHPPSQCSPAPAGTFPALGWPAAPTDWPSHCLSDSRLPAVAALGIARPSDKTVFRRSLRGLRPRERRRMMLARPR